ncbi:hypothetical protein [Marinobacter sp.]|uniref:hypothetical protein n=1 Tax=Marinobacter sp. TaxID=50741 RepID=UPI003F9D9CD7
MHPLVVGDTQDLRWWLVAQATNCDILEPQWLRNEIESTVAESLERIRSGKIDSA